MATQYPGALDAFPDPLPSDKTNSATVGHAGQHKNVNDAIEAIQSELGTNPKGNYSSVRARLDQMTIDLEDALTGSGGGGGGGGGLSTEEIQDLVAAMAIAGVGVSISYNDILDTLTFTNSDRGSAAVTAHVAEGNPHPTYFNTATGDARYSLLAHDHAGVYSPVAHNHDATYAAIVHVHTEYAPVSHTHSYSALGHTHTSSEITNFTEAVQDVIGSTITAGANVSVSYDDSNGLVFINSGGGGGGGIGTVYYQPGPPATPFEGEVWFSTATPVFGIQIPSEPTATPNFSVTKAGVMWYKDSVLMLDNGRFLQPIGGDPTKYWVSHTDLFSAGSQAGFAQVAANGGNVGADSGGLSTSHIGIAALETGTTSNATGRAQFGGTQTSSQAMYTASFVETMYEAIVRIPILNDGANDFAVHCGYTNTQDISGGDATDGVYFRYSNANLTWSSVCANNSVLTVQDSGITVTAGVWYRLRIHIIGSNLAYFYINDQLRNVMSSGLPGASRNFTYSTEIAKRQSSVNNRQLLLDYMYCHHIINNART